MKIHLKNHTYKKWCDFFVGTSGQSNPGNHEAMHATLFPTNKIALRLFRYKTFKCSIH